MYGIETMAMGSVFSLFTKASSFLKYSSQMYFLQKSYNAHESAHREKWINSLKNSKEYMGASYLCLHLAKNSFYVRKECGNNFLTAKDIGNKIMYGNATFTENNEKSLLLFKDIIKLQEDIGEEIAQKVYDSNYYERKIYLLSKINHAAKNITSLKADFASKTLSKRKNDTNQEEL